MGKWRLEGIDSESGEPRAMTVEAAEHDRAVRFAAKRGLTLVKATRLDDEPADGLADLAAAQAASGGRTAAGPRVEYAGTQTPRSPVAYATPAATRLPTYAMLQFWCRVLAGVSWLLVGMAGVVVMLGLVVAVAGLFGAAGAGARGGGAGWIAAAGGTWSLILGIQFLVAGAPLGILAYGGLAVRDIAINSHRR